MTLLVELYVLLATSIISNIILFIALAVTMKRSEKKELEIVKYWKKIWREAKDSSDFWQMIIFDDHKTACGGVIYRTITEEEKSKRYLRFEKIFALSVSKPSNLIFCGYFLISWSRMSFSGPDP